jgi:anti-sigma regulatory factor (Ser/Thr protein kinase)
LRQLPQTVGWRSVKTRRRTAAAMHLADDASATRQARQYARLFGAQYQLPGTTAADLELVVDELVTNAIRHAAPPVELRLYHVNGVIRGHVSDGSCALPHINNDPDQWGGFGLRILNDTTTRWGTTPLQAGKQIWFEIK